MFYKHHSSSFFFYDLGSEIHVDWSIRVNGDKGRCDFLTEFHS